MKYSFSLPSKPQLKDYQSFVKKVVEHHSFQDENLEQIFMLFLEECGELAKAVRKTTGVHTDPKSQVYNTADEAADVFVYLLDICNHLNIDLEKAFRVKMNKNQKRTWKNKK